MKQTSLILIGLACGLVEAMSQVAVTNRPLILVAYDAPYPEPLRTCRPVTDAFGVALVLAPQRTGRSVARLRVTIDAGEPATMADPAMEEIRRSIPTAQALPLLALLAREASGTVVQPYLDPVDPARPSTRLLVEVAD